MMRYIAQEESDGCLVACVAMVTGRTYREIRAMCDVGYDGGRGRGINEYIADDILGELGFAVMRRYKHQLRFGRDRIEWPGLPFAPVHIAYVSATQGPHAVVVLGDGVVYDPFSVHRHSLRDPVYAAIHHIDGIWRAHP